MPQEEILKKLEAIERNSLLAAKNVLNFDEASIITGFSKGHLYRLTSERQIPYYKKGKYIYFDRSELEGWMKENRVQTKQEAEAAALAYVAQN